MLLQHCRVSASLIFVYCLQSDDSSSGGFTLQQQLCQNTNSGNMKSGEEAALCSVQNSATFRTLLLKSGKKVVFLSEISSI